MSEQPCSQKKNLSPEIPLGDLFMVGSCFSGFKRNTTSLARMSHQQSFSQVETPGMKL
ncbi:MAG: hypothetical protein ACI8ZB_004424 [Desulforhopalus sp.]|jgi:hypothetical protein